MIKGLHHNAYRCRDSEETRGFYEDFLGLRLVSAFEIGGGSGLHTFFEMDDGSCLAFFEVPGKPFDFKLQEALHRPLQSGKPAFVPFSAAEIGAAQSIGAAGYDAVVFEMEHNPYDIRSLRDCMQYMLDRAQILKSGSLAPAVAPMVRIPPNGGELNQFIAKQVLDIGVYGIVWPHVSTVEDARNAVQACRYPRPPSAPYYEPAGQRGHAPRPPGGYWAV